MQDSPTSIPGARKRHMPGQAPPVRSEITRRQRGRLNGAENSGAERPAEHSVQPFRKSSAPCQCICQQTPPMRGSRDPWESEVADRAARRSKSCIDSPVPRPRFRLAVVRRPVASLSELVRRSNTARPVHKAQCHPMPTSARWDYGQRRPNSIWLCTASRTRKDSFAQPSTFRPRMRTPRGEPLYSLPAARTSAFEVRSLHLRRPTPAGTALSKHQVVGREFVAAPRARKGVAVRCGPKRAKIE